MQTSPPYRAIVSCLALCAACDPSTDMSDTGSGGTATSSQTGSQAGPGSSTAKATAVSSASSTGATSSTSSTGSGGGAPGQGIAAQYPGDVGIDNDPAVLLADGFEDYAQPSDLYERWDNVNNAQGIHIVTNADNVMAGHKAIEFRIPQAQGEMGRGIDKLLTEERDVLFLRYYSKFDTPFDVVGSSHNGSAISAHYYSDGQATPGIPADGQNKFLVALENWRGEPQTPSPGHLNVYVYHPEQRSQWGDHFFPTGIVMPGTAVPFDFGPEFVSRPDILTELNRWFCYEYMVKANTPGERNGQISVWVDGKLVADFTNLRFRDIGSLRIDRFGLGLHIGSNPAGETSKWFDNVVAATSYIGPLAQ